MGQRQDPPLLDLSGLGSQLGDLDRKLVKDLEAAPPDKSGTIKRYDILVDALYQSCCTNLFMSNTAASQILLSICIMNNCKIVCY